MDGQFVVCVGCFESLTDCLSPATAAHSNIILKYEFNYIIVDRVDPVHSNRNDNPGDLNVKWKDLEARFESYYYTRAKPTNDTASPTASCGEAGCNPKIQIQDVFHCVQ